jgi:hypothetical protein
VDDDPPTPTLKNIIFWYVMNVHVAFIFRIRMALDVNALSVPL